MIESLIRDNIKKLKPYTSARDLYTSGVLLDANENPYQLDFGNEFNLNLNRYPDPHQIELRNRLSGIINVPSQNLFFGNGSDEIIDLLIRIFCEPREDEVMLVEPTYGMYKVACDVNNVNTISVLLNNNFQIDFKEIEKNYSEKIKIIFLCSPNNPTGNLLSKEDIINLCNKFKSAIIVDEAYIDFAGGGTIIDEIKNYENLIVLRTFSKAWGLAGIRLGYCATNENVIDYLFKVKAPYNINQLTKHYVLEALDKYEQKELFVKEILEEKVRLINELKKLKLEVFNSDANFFMIRCNNALKIQKEIAAKGVIIRDRSTQPKLENCLRITVGTKQENDLLITLLKEYL